MSLTELLNNYIILAGGDSHLVAWDGGEYFAVFYEYDRDGWQMARLYRVDGPVVCPMVARNLAMLSLMNYLYEHVPPVVGGIELVLTVKH